MASNPLVDIFRIKDLRDRILFTVAMLLVFRLGAVLPIPGVNVTALNAFFTAQQSSGTVGITDYFDFFSGGAFTNFSIFMLGIVPYITTSIIMQLLLMVFPKLKKISEQEGGRKRIQRYTRYGTVLVCLVQSFTVTEFANSIPDAITMARVPYTIIAMLTVTAGTVFLMWVGEQITQRGIGNGISLLIFAGIVARVPNAIWIIITQIQRQDLNPVYAIVVFGVFVGVIALIVYEQQGQRKIPVNYAKRVVGRRVYGAQNAYLPFKINPSGVIPVIFASSVLIFPVADCAESGQQPNLAVAVCRVAAPERGTVCDHLRSADYLLCLLLYPGDSEPGRDRAPDSRERRLHSWNQLREHARIPDSYSQPHHPARSAVPGIHRDYSVDHSGPVRISVVGCVSDGWHLAADYGRGGSGYHESDRGAPEDASP